jgi:5-deoxy-glucuronate isomerase
VTVDGSEFVLQGRADVFAGATDIAYLPPGSTFHVRAEGPARIALPFAVVQDGRSAPGAHRIDAADVPVEMRGAGVASREVRNFGTPATLQAASIIACEVLTPAGNWSSWPPHKHDEHVPGVESELEEIYYYELAAVEGAPADTGAMGYQRVYGTPERPFDVLAEIRSGDVVLIPHGWHGPSTAPPGYDLYYLNVMAGPGPERAWLITDDPAHGWVRDRWEHESVDPRLPFGGTR